MITVGLSMRARSLSGLKRWLWRYHREGQKSRRASITALGGVPVMDENGEHITFASLDEGLSTDINKCKSSTVEIDQVREAR
jgi:hypothetical protein